jgi:predicted amidohydrolase YtcJ
MSYMRIERFAHLLAKADLPIRVRAILFSDTDPRGRDLSEIGELRKQRTTPPRVKVSGIKWILDGTPFERGAALRNQYLDRPDWKGKLLFDEREVASMVREALSSEQQFLVHCAGDRCAEVVLDAMEKTGRKINWKQKRWRIEHGDGVVGNLVPRASRLGMVVVQNPIHFIYPELFRKRWGAGMMPLRSLLVAGIHVALGSDGPMNPYLNIMLATVHPYSPKEAITREQAVEAYTRGSAYAEFAEAEKGTIATGKLADLTILSQDIFSARADELPRTQSLLTIVGGKVVYDAGALR